MELLFLSFTTLSSTGLERRRADQAVRALLVMIEQLGRLAYVAGLVSRLVAPDGPASAERVI